VGKTDNVMNDDVI